MPPPTAFRTDQVRGLEQQVGVMIHRIRRVIADRARAVHPDLQTASYLMLSRLVHQGPQRASTLVETFGIDKGAISRQVQHLADLGLVERTPDPDDGRASLISATPVAVERMSTAAEARRRWIEERLGDWSEEELTSFVDLLRRYNLALDPDRHGRGPLG